ncbi:mitochondria-eating protein-like isoform X1 [Tachypleus tridentatus]|uniref:mitochondria-eating protein-like isoform X1 n=1 Tax=Tachypleus tridentatus TaxID=6853 RepID=UPI003FD22619
MPEFSYMKAAGRSCLKWWFLRCCKESCLTDDQVCDMCNENVSYNNSGMVNEGVILNDDTHSDPCEAKTQAKEVLLLRSELNKARKTIAVMQHRETLMKDRLAQQAQKMLDRGVKFENVCLGERRPTALIRRYGNLYAQARVDTLDVLESFSELQSSDELKSKLLFSVVVLAFSSVQNTVSEIKSKLRQILQIPRVSALDVNLEVATKELDASIDSYLRCTVDMFDINISVEDVCSQIWATLYDYPSLKTCEGLLLYVRDCVRLAWGLINQTPPYVISFDTCTFNRNIHVRFHSSNQDSQEIKTYLWPALLEGQNGPCVYKGVVIT